MQELEELELLSDAGTGKGGSEDVRVPALLQMAANQVQQDSSLTQVYIPLLTLLTVHWSSHHIRVNRQPGMMCSKIS